MFGYFTTNADLLSKEEKARYQALYCGLCYVLGKEFGSIGRVTLTYDMTFLSALLSAVYDMPETEGTLRCPVNPLRQCDYVTTEATAYAADMNLVLAYYKYLDDWQDDHNLAARGKSRLLAPKAEKALARWPKQSEAVQGSLRALGEMERDNELNPDRPANCFGDMMGALFVMREDAQAPQLRRMGAALGRFVYIMDACMDLAADIQKERYNPLIAQMETDYTPLLTMLIGEATGIFEELPHVRDERILRNILYSGVWVKYETKTKGQEKRHDRSV